MLGEPACGGGGGRRPTEVGDGPFESGTGLTPSAHGEPRAGGEHDAAQQQPAGGSHRAPAVRKRLGRGKLGESLHAQQQHRVDREHQTEEQLPAGGVVRLEILGPPEHQQPDDQRSHDHRQQGDLALDRGSLGLDETAPVGLSTSLLGERTQHGGGPRAALHGDQESGGDEIAERVVDVVGEAAEHDRRILAPEARRQAAAPAV